MEDKTYLGYFDRDRILAGEVPFPSGATKIDKDKMSGLLEEYRNKLFPYHSLDDFMPPNDMTKEDIKKLM